MTTWWTVVADRTVARVFSSESRMGSLAPVVAIHNPDGRLKAQDLKSDAPGSIASQGGDGFHGTYGDWDAARDQVVNVFVKEVATMLKRGLNEKKYESLRLVAEPQVLGKIRAALDKEVAERVQESLPKDLAQVPDPELPDRVRAAIA